jgi:hypothetical protein
MSLNLIYICLWLSALFCVRANAQKIQEDYIVNTRGDTLAAVFKHNLKGDLKYRTIKDTQFKEADATVVTAYHFKTKDVTYRARLVPNKGKLFLLALIAQGKINLYQLIVYGYHVRAIYWYADKNRKGLVEIKNNIPLGGDKEHKRNFNQLISDTPSMVDQSSRQNYSLKSIINLINQYNTRQP